MEGYAWAIFGIFSAVMTAAMMLLQERLKVEPFALSIWCKIVCVVVLLPLVFIYGLPQDPMFYAYIAPTAVIFCIGDVIFFRRLPQIGAGVVSRLMPLTVIANFFLWFAVDPSLLQTHIAHPWVSLMIVLAIFAAVFFAMRLRKCTVTMQAVRLLWFMLVSNMVGPLLTKAATGYAPPLQAGIAYTFVQAAMMIAIWVIYLLVAKPLPLSSLLKKQAWQPSLMIGGVMAVAVTVYVISVDYVDNPGYVSAVRLINTVLILAAHKMMGKKDDSDVVSGFGIVASAFAVIVLREQL